MSDFTLLQKLCLAFAPSGDEKAVRDIIIEEIKPFCTSLKIDRMGNLIAFKKGAEKTEGKLLFDAHMDEVGMMVSAITDEGYLKFETVGGIDNRILPAKRVKVGELDGVIASKPIHLMTKEERKRPVEIKDMYIDIGASDRADAEKQVAVGDYISFDPSFETFGEASLKGKALDDRLGCFLLCNMIKKPLPYDATFTFSVEEECGLRGAAVAAYGEKPDIAVAIDSTTASDLPGVPEQSKVCVQGLGGVLSVIDGATVYDRELFEKVTKKCDRENIPYQVKRMATGGNNAASLQRAGIGARVISLSAPCRYIHAPAGTVCISDIKSMEAILDAIIKVCGKMISEKVEK